MKLHNLPQPFSKIQQGFVIEHYQQQQNGWLFEFDMLHRHAMKFGLVVSKQRVDMTIVEGQMFVQWMNTNHRWAKKGDNGTYKLLLYVLHDVF